MATAYVFESDRLRALDWQPRRTLRWLAWRPDGGLALAAGNGGYAVLTDGRRLDELDTHTRQNLRGAGWSADGASALLVGNRGVVLRMRGEAVQEVASPTTENLRRVAWHPSGAYALVIGNSGTVLHYSAQDGVLVGLPGDRAHTLRSVAFRPDGEYALIGAYASRFAGYPRPHALYRCDGRFLQSLLATDDEDDCVSIDWSSSLPALICGYARLDDGSLVNKAVTFDGSAWQTLRWPSRTAVLGGAWQPGTESALMAGESGLLMRLTKAGSLEPLDGGVTDNLIGPFWRPDGAEAILLKGPDANVYTV